MSVVQKLIGVVLVSGILLAFVWGGSTTKVEPVFDVPSVAEAKAPPTILVELFTSQGCSSCPPADRVLQRLVDDAGEGDLNVIALSYHVDYWNRLGWKDPYSQAAFSDRQRDYARLLPEHRVYTPQMVIQGQSSHVGSREQEVRTAIRKVTISGESTTITVDLKAANDKTPERRLDYQLTGRTEDVLLQVAIVETALDNDVPRGENRGRHLTHTHVVLDLQTLRAPSTSGTLSLNPEVLAGLEQGKVVLFIQDTENWDVLGAVEVEL